MGREITRGSDPICPYCGFEYVNACDLGMSQDEEQDLDCGKCGKTYRTTCDYAVSYESEEIDEEEINV